MLKKDLETNAYQNEFFPLIEEASPTKSTSSSSKKKSQSMAKVIAATTVLTVSVIGVTVIIDNRIPTISSPIIANYQKPYYDETTNESYYGSYDLIFEVNPSSSLIDSVILSLQKMEMIFDDLEYENNKFQVIEEIKETYPLDSLEQGDNGNYLIYYPIDDATYRYEIDFIINYYEENNNSLKSYKRGTYVSDYTYFLTSERYNQNKINYLIKENQVDIELIINDFHKGTFDFQIDGIEIEYNGELYENEAIASDFPLKINKDGPIKYKFSLPKYDLDSVILYVRLLGDCYLDNEAMELESSTFIIEEIIQGTSYKVEPINFSKNNPNLSVNGLTLGDIYYSRLSGNYKSKLDKVLPGSEVLVSLVLIGEASKEFNISATININEEKINDFDFSYTSLIPVYQGDQMVTIEFSFIMPEENVLSSDIIIEQIYEDNV